MSVSLTKGASISLSKANSDAGSTSPLTKVVAGAGWDAKDGKSIDLDLMIVQVASDGKAIPDDNGNGTNLDEALLFFNNMTLPGLKHSGDNLTGEGDGDDEQIVVTLADVAQNVNELAVVVASYSGETFDEIENAFVRLVNEADNTELAKFELTSGFAGTRGVELGRLKRNGAEWDFAATGNSVAGDFNAIVASYGITS